MRTIMHIIFLFVLVLNIQPTVSEIVECYAMFNIVDGTCGDLLGQVSLDDCCMNPLYGYEKDGVCKSCRLASWTTWSRWSSCSVTCTEGVKQRQRYCYGLGKCKDPNLVGNKQTKPCEDLSCCPENGEWSKWSVWQPCSVTCQSGTRIRTRTCSDPPPMCGGACEGDREEVENCDTGIVCPIHGGWAAWGNWGECGGTCEVEGFFIPQQQRHRSCSNPPPSLVPRGNKCPGSNVDTQHCTGLPFCAVNGNWGPWSASSDCSVTCGVGIHAQHRSCDSPEPKYGGKSCTGSNSRTSICIIQTNCPADGHWNEWSEWSNCDAPNERSITCRNRLGRRRRLRDCIGRDYGGAYCDGENVQFDHCYDIQGCIAGPDLQIPGALWSEWSEWSYCKPDCGEHSTQTRKRVCIPDISNYSEQRREIFTGKPKIFCPPAEETEETRRCLNLPPC